MGTHKLLRHIAVYGVSLPTFVVSPAVAKPTIYMPSQVAARVFGGRPASPAPAQDDHEVQQTSHAA